MTGSLILDKPLFSELIWALDKRKTYRKNTCRSLIKSCRLSCGQDSDPSPNSPIFAAQND